MSQMLNGKVALITGAAGGIGRGAEYAPKIRINSVCPGWIDTEMVRNTITQHGPAVLARVPLGRVAEPKELGEMVC